MNLTKICGFKRKKAQHIVELVLLAPFIMFFIGIVYQIAITIHTNYKFNASLYEAISFMALTNKINSTKEETLQNIEKYAKILLKERHTPYENSLKTELISTGDIDFIIGFYKYTSTFKIFNHLDNFNPQAYNYLTIIPVNSAILRKNSFEIPNTFFEDEFEAKPSSSLNESEDKNMQEPQFSNNSQNNAQDHNIEIPEVEFQ